MAETKQGYDFDQTGVIAASSIDSGYEWEPVELLSEFLGFPVDEVQIPKNGLNPAQIYDEFLFHGIRLEGYLNEEDEFCFPDGEIREQARGIFEESMYRHGDRLSGYK